MDWIEASLVESRNRRTRDISATMDSASPWMEILLVLGPN